MQIRVGIFDDHPLTSKGLADYILEANAACIVLFNAQSKEHLFTHLTATAVDVVVLDIIAPDVEGLEVFEIIRKNYPAVGIIAYSTLNSAILIENLLSIGVGGFVNKKQDPAQLLHAIQQVYDGEISVPEEYKFLTKKFRDLHTTLLSKREQEILRLIAKEMTSQEIAENLFLSLSTVENHRQNIFRKLEVRNIAGMIMAATRMGYIS